jgi:methylase of polypeptide subunit release factors
MKHLPAPRDAPALAHLRQIVATRGDKMAAALGPRFRLPPRIEREVQRRRLAGDPSEAAILAQLFLLSEPVPADEAARALAPLTPATFAETNLATIDGGLLRPRVRIAAYSHLVLVHDAYDRIAAGDFVTGPNPVAERADRLTIRRPAGSALDLGTGPGIQALLAAQHCKRVIAVDVNDRAVAFTRFNAALNGLSNVEARLGSWLEPVAGERFDLVVANPPYVVSPDTTFLYRDGELLRDDVAAMLLRDIPAHLEEGGFAHVTANWIHGRDEEWRRPLERWLTGSGCDALLLRYGGLDLVSYAAAWNLDLALHSPKRFLATVDRWLEYYRREGIESIADGMVVLRRRRGRNWVRAIEVPGRPLKPAGAHLLRLFEAHDRRDELADDDGVLSTPFAPAPGLKIVWRARGKGLSERSARAELEDGIGFAVPLRSAVADLLASLDGSRPLRKLAGGDPAVAADMRRLFSLGLIETPPASN